MNQQSSPAKDEDPQETSEWLEALVAVIREQGPERAHYIIEQLAAKARRKGINIPYQANTAYINTIPPKKEAKTPGNPAIEHRLRSIIRWNAMAMVHKTNMRNSDLGGHISSFASSATLYDVGFNHFFHAQDENHGGDLIFFQGHASPGIYSRAFLEGRLEVKQLERFRQEIDKPGLSSYPHPWLMPSFWQFPTVSMGLGPIMSIYQARFTKYLQNRGLIKQDKRKVWAFTGDGEMDEPESMGAIGMAGREKLDNLIFVVNCNLQRLDGPVRGDGKIIQELEADFRGAGWNVIKVIWGSGWDALLAKDDKGLLRKRMEEVVDGEYQAYKAKGGAFTRKHFFGKYPELLDMVSSMSDDDIWRLSRGGHDPHKVYAAYHEAVNHEGQPTVILAKTVKGYGMGDSGEGQNITHQQKKMNEDSIRAFRDRFNIPVTDEQLADVPFYKPAEDSEEMTYLHQRRKALGGYLPQRKLDAPFQEIPDLSMFAKVLKGREREQSTTMAFVDLLRILLRDKKLGKYIVPIIPDEARTFGMDGLFSQYGIYSSVGQLYEPEDSAQIASYDESQTGQLLQEGINEAGAMCSWIAAATAYANHSAQMIPFYIYYSMFGYQRVGDLMWAAGDMQARGFLLGGTAGRTTLAGEGLQHQDGHSPLLHSTIPNCVSYDPAYAYELAVIMHNGLQRMYQNGEAVFYYITVMNENYSQPELPKGTEADIIKGMYQLSKSRAKSKIQLLGSGTILREVIAGAELLKKDFKIDADVWSVTSFSELRREGLSAERWNRLHPESTPKTCHVEDCLDASNGPIIAATDYMKIVPDQIRPFIKRSYTVLGTDGFGRSDAREALRSFFEVDRYHVVIAALKALADEGTVPMATVSKAIKLYNINPETPEPVTV